LVAAGGRPAARIVTPLGAAASGRCINLAIFIVIRLGWNRVVTNSVRQDRTPNTLRAFTRSRVRRLRPAHPIFSAAALGSSLAGYAPDDDAAFTQLCTIL
jgi:hypothetical protein